MTSAAFIHAFQDLRFSVRLLRRNPILSLAIVATLGLGIGLASTVFNITNAFVHQPLPFADSERLLVVRRAATAKNTTDMGVTVHDLTAWREQQSAFERLTAYLTLSVDLAAREGWPERYPGALFSAGVFETLGVQTICSSRLHRLGTVQKLQVKGQPRVACRTRGTKNLSCRPGVPGELRRGCAN